MGMLHKVEEVWRKNSLSTTSGNVDGICILQVVVVSSPHQSPRCGVSRFRSAQSITIPLSVVCFDFAGTLKQKVGVALPAPAALPPKRQFDG